MPTPHSTDNYSVGKGILSIAPWSGTTPPSAGDYADMGNCTSMEVEPKIERLPHYSSRAGFKTKDKNAVTQTEYTVTIALDEMAAVNVNKYLLGTVAGNVVHAMTNTDGEFGLKYVSDNPLGPNETWEFWRMTLTPNGALQLIGDEWMSMSIMGDGLSDVANHASSPYFDVTYATTTTTTTTTTTSA